jgi:hypothetical protein
MKDLLFNRYLKILEISEGWPFDDPEEISEFQLNKVLVVEGPTDRAKTTDNVGVQSIEASSLEYPDISFIAVCIRYEDPLSLRPITSQQAGRVRRSQ